MNSQQLADHLLAQWQSLSSLPPVERLARIDEIRRSMPRPEANDNDTPQQSAARAAMTERT